VAENLRLRGGSNAPLIGRTFIWTAGSFRGFMYLPEKVTEAAMISVEVNRLRLEKAYVEWPALLILTIEFYAVRETCT
jgi:hypothetical protein